jgi:hypothetical protein
MDLFTIIAVFEYSKWPAFKPSDAVAQYGLPSFRPLLFRPLKIRPFSICPLAISSSCRFVPSPFCPLLFRPLPVLSVRHSVRRSFCLYSLSFDPVRSACRFVHCRFGLISICPMFISSVCYRSDDRFFLSSFRPSIVLSVWLFVLKSLGPPWLRHCCCTSTSPVSATASLVITA